MKNTSLRVALNMYTLSIPEKIRKATSIVDALTSNAGVFATPIPDLKTLSNVIDNLHAAYLDAADGGKSKTAAMHDTAEDLLQLMKQLALYVEQVAGNDASIVHLSGLDIRKQGTHDSASFSATPAGQGAVSLQVKAHKDTVYKWQYSADNGSTTPAWVDVQYSKLSRVTLNGLSTGIYLFRVIFIDGAGEHTGSTLKVAVN